MKYGQILAALVSGILGTILIVVGVSTWKWFTYDRNFGGLFIFCLPTRRASYTAGGSVGAARALAIIGLVQSAAGAILLIVYVVKHLGKDTPHRVLTMVTAILLMGPGGEALIGAIVFATSEFAAHVSFSYSFALTIIGAICTGVGGVLVLIHRIRIQNE